jgi:hypothetical protein
MVTKSPLSLSWKDLIVKGIGEDLSAFDGHRERGACEILRSVLHEAQEAVEVSELYDEAVVYCWF